MQNLSLLKITSLLFAVAFTAMVAGCAATGGTAADVSSNVAADVATERSILAAINDDPGLDGQGIGVSCINGVVTLRGSVDSAIESNLAARIAENIDGVTEVNNLLSTN